VDSSCERSNEPSSSMQCWGSVEWLLEVVYKSTEFVIECLLRLLFGHILASMAFLLFVFYR
jgi:hypothetical protein